MKILDTQNRKIKSTNGFEHVTKMPKGKVFVWGDCLIGNNVLEKGFKWLDRWDLIVASRPYSELAMDVVTDKNREKALKTLGDLRVPLPDSRAMFLKDSQKARSTYENWLVLKNEYNEHLALLIAIWYLKPYYKLLPAGKWIT